VPTARAGERETAREAAGGGSCDVCLLGAGHKNPFRDITTPSTVRAQGAAFLPLRRT
jgi:hypothetical protein